MNKVEKLEYLKNQFFNLKKLENCGKYNQKEQIQRDEEARFVTGCVKR